MKKILISQEIIDSHNSFCNQHVKGYLEDIIKNINNKTIVNIKLSKKLIDKYKIDFNEINTSVIQVYLTAVYPYLNSDSIDRILSASNRATVLKAHFPETMKLVEAVTERAYNTFSGSAKARDFTNELNIAVCPYCNMNYIFTYYKKSSNGLFPNGTVRPEIDHFFPQVKYPYLAISLYNMVPSCHQCNSSIKGQKIMELSNFLHPYFDNMDELVKFERKIDYRVPNCIETILGLNDNFSIKVNKRSYRVSDDDYERALNTIEFFHIINLYEHRRKEIQRSIRKELKYNKYYLRSLNQLVPPDYLKSSNFGKVDERFEIHQEVLGKLFNDIFS